MGATLVILAVALACLGLQGLHKDAEFEKDAGHATARIYQLSLSPSGHLLSTGLFAQAYPTSGARFSYLSGNAGFVAGRAAVSRETYRRLHPDDVVPIVYLLRRPDDARIDWPEEARLQWRQDEFFLGFCLLLGAFGYLMFWRAGRRPAFRAVTTAG
ncbi:MAG: hypothetical protein WDO13_10925 [Verrucomicrobiota bacterium]